MPGHFPHQARVAVLAVGADPKLCQHCCPPVVNFINILRAAFVPIFLCQKTMKPNCTLRKAWEKTFVQKVERKMLDEIDTWAMGVLTAKLNESKRGKVARVGSTLSSGWQAFRPRLTD